MSLPVIPDLIRHPSRSERWRVWRFGPRIKSGVTVGVDGMPDDYSAMTVNERLAAAGLSVEYDAAVASGDLAATTEILAKVDLRRDAAGMHWSLGNGRN
jgi:hypothetical protein